ncbi:calcium-translocating P-type ATPase, PMCA-type [Anaerovorax odorimutans]|uniref:calcium-translocating P-type ATPase, PMCA-type n=1 Tax=Anaerovorax odorimutans TaxID=109327 RepID=UPI00040FD40A|nr:calcium-translocating P-type ATPase, PMCA-type [Anaerovorax odorimutans]
MYYNKSETEILNELKSNKDGLTKGQVIEHREKYGENQLEETKKKSFLQVFFGQFRDLLVIILIIAAIISMLTGNVESTLVIFFVIILNAILGTIQHFKAEKSLQSLKDLSSPKAKVIRDGKREVIDSKDIVVGDIVVLEAGDLVPADGRIIENYSLQVNESALTGESEGVTKTEEIIESEDVALGDQKNMVFSSSLVTYGRASIVITSTGMNTELGKIATMMNLTAERKTPLQVSLDNFSKKLSIIILIICALILGLSIYRGMEIIDSLMFAVALAVAAIPEALSSIVTISLAIGTSKMAKENAIIKNLRAVEGLGCVSIICSDKTGTLTQNKMTVKNKFTFSENETEKLLLASVLCNDSCLIEGKPTGDPTETALIDYYLNNNKNYEEILRLYSRLAEIPFDSDRKIMSTVHELDGEYLMFSKGAVDVLATKMNKILENGKERPITDDDIEKIKQENFNMSNNGLRVLAFAQKTVPDLNITLDSENQYTFIGLIAMIDPPREESKKAVSDCFTAGIKPIMITGDHKITASSIAKQIGILKEEDMAITGVELNKISDEELIQILPKISVYARVSPEHKIRIVEMWQKLGHIVAMTGDGVNDAPALKKADIGIAMGITGTEVSKDAASMILTDDNFATIIKSVTNGRNIYANIKNSIKFLLSGNTSGILAVLFTSLMALPVPFTAVHLLFINLLTDSLPAIAIGMEKSTTDLLKEKPRSSKESILTKDFLIAIGIQGFLIAVFTIIAYYKGLEISAETARTMAFSTLCMARLWHGFNSRGKYSIFKLGLFSNLYSIGAFIIGMGLLSCALFIPALQNLFEVLPLSINNLIYIIVCAVAPTVIIQISRVIKELIKKS